MEKGGRKKNVIWPQSLLSDLPVGVEEELIKQQSCLPTRHYRQDNIHSKCVKAEGKCMMGFCGRLWFFSHHFLRTLTVSVRIVIGKSAGNLLIAALLQHQCCELCCLRMQAFFCSLWLSVSVSAFFFVCALQEHWRMTAMFAIWFLHSKSVNKAVATETSVHEKSTVTSETLIQDS